MLSLPENQMSIPTSMPQQPLVKAESSEDQCHKDFELKMSYWSKMRDVIVHEDNLVNHRFSWLLAFEGLSMGGFFAVENYLLTKESAVAVVVGAQILLFCLMIAAVWICIISGQTISAAYRQIWSVYQTWIRRYPDEVWPACPVPKWLWPWNWQAPGLELDAAPPNSEFPPLRGEFSYSNVSRTQRIPFILCVINALAAVSCVLIAIAATWDIRFIEVLRP